jgi:hypothetical protein
LGVVVGAGGQRNSFRKFSKILNQRYQKRKKVGLGIGKLGIKSGEEVLIRKSP